MTDRIDELQRLHEAATKGPWRADVTPPGPCGQVLRCESVVAHHASRDIVMVARRGTTHGVQWFKDATYIAAMRNALPALLRVARAAKAIRERNQVSDWVFTDTGKLTDHGELFAGLDELERDRG